MVRVVFRILCLAGVAVVVLPFLVSSIYVDQRGITIPGHVYSKQEYISVRYGSWQRTCDLTIEYRPPDSGGISYTSERLTPEEYDSLRKGQTVSLHYLRSQDVPDLPLAHLLRQAHLLPTARLASQGTFSRLESLFTRRVVMGAEVIVAIIVVLVLWRKNEWPGFAWAVAVCVLSGIGLLLYSGFPMPVRGPIANVRHASAKVKSVHRIEEIFETQRRHGMDAMQPIDVVGIEFVPEGRPEPVVAVDLIDADSVPGLKEGSAVDVEYEVASPRTARIDHATRDFPRRNLGGVVVEAGLSLAVIIGFLAVAHFVGKAWKRFLARAETMRKTCGTP